MKFALLIFLLFTVFLSIFCLEDTQYPVSDCERGQIKEKSYLFYDINPGEGFNLRRDVYMRIAVLIKKILKTDDWILVLPPWGPLYHWKSKDVGPQTKLNWSLFFSLESLRRYIPVMELSDLVKDHKEFVIDQVIILEHYKDPWENGKWEEKYEFKECKSNSNYWRTENKMSGGFFWSYDTIQTRNVTCLYFQGHAQKLIPVLTNHLNQAQHLVMIDRAEIPLHDEYGSSEYWKVRRSMRFSDRLYSLANAFRRQFLYSDDESDLTILPEDWRDESPEIVAKGGPYICGHLRRQDFLRGRANDVPSVQTAAKVLIQTCKSSNVSTIFIASDGTDQEMEQLRRYLEPEYRLQLYRPGIKERQEIKDGGVAIVEQIVCSRARHFIGSHESTFSFRIQEEREILNFPPHTTFNRFCGDGQTQCEQPSKWRIIY